MAFTKEVAIVPASIQSVRVNLLLVPGDTPRYDAQLEVSMVMTDGSVRSRVIDRLEPHLSATQRTAARNFLDAMLAKAQAEIL